MAFGSKVVKSFSAHKQAQSLPGSKSNTSTNQGGKNLWHKMADFVTSPTGIIVVIGLIILVHYAWQGHKHGAKAK